MGWKLPHGLSYEAVLERPNGMLGPDGIPYSTWKNAEADPADGIEVFRRPFCTRPLSMSDTDIKLIADVVTITMTENLSHLVDNDQACLRGRDMTAHIVRAGARGLCQHIKSVPFAPPFLADFSAAFPSLASERFLRVLECMRQPEHIDLGPILSGPQMFDDVANLKLNLAKCEIASCGDLDLIILKKAVEGNGDPADKLLAVSWAVYPGIPSGPDGYFHVWDPEPKPVGLAPTEAPCAPHAGRPRYASTKMTPDECEERGPPGGMNGLMVGGKGLGKGGPVFGF
ncbi:unnamed protein product [Prorocentrum cordatum]|uniref:Poly(ADP-ribose) glycohydrolase n=1 Tax=Prorocentrum cordatum TaxID=2364126 RepID=A0ABN9X8D3_9DINO|nr:unnamed protein product [Polarella glacialis]